MTRCLERNVAKRPYVTDMLRTVNSWLFFQMIDQRDETSALDFLDKGGFDIDYKTKGQHGHITALHLACKFGCVQVLQTLI